MARRMTTMIPTRSRDEFKARLAHEIRRHVIGGRKSITFIDCANSLSPYLFKRKELPRIMDRVFFARIETAYDLADQLKELPADPYFRSSGALFVSDWRHLLDDLPRDEQERLTEEIEDRLELLSERHGKPVTVLEVVRRSAIQSRLSATSSTTSCQT
ncbi:hypothetical protein JXB02_05205 [Candidatus Woesearchaeota archaeon]|nr:hypothetical protein [Candidatus Woesearchaeota archaeon]